MGIILSAQIPNQILPVEAYLADISDVEFVESLGSTRFMKVARVDHAEGPSLAKVFLLQDPSFPVEPYRNHVMHVRYLLRNAYNCCPFRRVYITARCVALSRCFQKYTLYDRLNTRPFLMDIEKKWIIYSLIKALAQCESADVFHGDLKMQNVLISSSNWVQIADFASFKPANIPSDDPSYFTFFFDTSRRLSCYLAPERFCTSQELNLHPNLPGEYMDIPKGLTHAMDVFSLGCVLVEFLTEGHCPFTYELLVKYKHASDAEAQVMVQNIQEQLPKEMRRLIGLMLHRNPAKRPEASVLLRKYSSILFPPIFDNFLYDYMNAFRPKFGQTNVSVEEQPISELMDSDDVIAKLTSDQKVVMEKMLERPQFDGKPIDQKPAALLVVGLITSNMRSLKSVITKCEAMKLLLQFATLLDASIVAERILPYMVNMLSDGMVQVRCHAIHSITSLLSSFNEVPRRETRVFIDYVFPILKIMATETHCMVKITLAQNLGTLAETSFRFMNEGSENLTEELLGGSVITEVDAKDREEQLARQEMKALHRVISDIFVDLCGSDNSVKHSVVTPQSLMKLCQFFDRRKSTDVLLSHMITFLNDKVDWRLRASFFECCPIIACFVGRQSTYILKSLLQQGLHDYEEFVQLRALRCICELYEQDLLEKAAVCELLTDIIPFLAHPNEYLRMITVNILSTLDKKFTVADILCKVMPAVEPYTKERLIRLRSKLVVAASLKPHIPRTVWNYVVNVSPVKSLLDFIADKQMYIALDGGPDSMFAVSRKHQPVSLQLESCLKHLENLGLDHNIEDKLVRFENTITKMTDFRASLGVACSNKNSGTIDLTGTNIKLRMFDLCSDQKSVCVKTVMANNPDVTEWNNIYSNNTALQPNVVGVSESAVPGVRNQSECVISASEFSSLGISRTFAVRSSASKVLLSELLTYKRNRYVKCQRYYQPVCSGSSSTDSNSSPPLPVRVGSTLIAHLREHKATVNKLAQNSNGYFASAGADGAVKLWSLSRIEDDFSSAVRADATFSYNGQEINSVQFVGRTGSHLAIASEDCRISVVDAERMQLLSKINFEKDEEGPPVDLISVENLLYVLTHHSHIICLDCRIPVYARAIFGRKSKVVWRHRIKNEYGLLTSFCLDPISQNWMCLTSTNRCVILWDLRFGMEVSSWPHPNDTCRMLRCWPAYSMINRTGSCTEIWTASSCAFELSRWNLETAQRTQVIWPSSGLKPLQYSTKDKHVTTALVTCPLTGRIFTGDSLGAIRSYNLTNPNECFYLSGPLRRTAEAISSPLAEHFASVRYTKSVVDTVEVLSETVTGKTDEPLYCANPLEVQMTVCHKTPVTDLLCCGEYLVSSSRDGAIKVWK